VLRTDRTASTRQEEAIDITGVRITPEAVEAFAGMKTMTDQRVCSSSRVGKANKEPR
jgi:hypothetical protein